MRITFVAVVLIVAAGCSSNPTTEPAGDLARVTLLNGFGANVDVLVDGDVKASSIESGAVTPIDISAGARTLAIRQAGSSASSSLGVQLSAGQIATFAALKSATGSLVVESLADSNAVVPTGATKVRVLHLAARSGEVQVWRTQPDYQTPIRWAFPFTYNSVNTYYQSTPGTWEVRVWTDSATSWATAQNTARVTLSGGAKKTIAILDRPGGGVRLEVIE
jgi:hypothetical protein